MAFTCPEFKIAPEKEMKAAICGRHPQAGIL
jgi:hypothetical protein